MPETQVSGIAMRGIVCTVPGDPIDVVDLGSMFGEEESRRVATTVGLDRLHRAMPGQTAGDLCVKAADRLLSDLKWERDSIDGMLMVTQTPDHFLPSTATILHGRLGLSSKCAAFDVNLGCSGFVYGLWLASLMIAAGTCTRFLLLVGDTLSQIVSSTDKGVAMLFGDAGSATAIERDESEGLWSFVTATDGTGWDKIIVPGGAFRGRAVGLANSMVYEDQRGGRDTALHMDGFDVFSFAMQRVPALVHQTLSLQGWDRETPDAFLFHQANKLITVSLARKLGLPLARVPSNIDKYGNTSGCTIPLLLADNLSGRITGVDRTKLVLGGFGVGYSWAGAAITIPALSSACVVRM